MKSGLVRHHGKSEIWNDLEKIVDTEKQKWIGDCKCKYCHKVIFSPSQIGTNKLWMLERPRDQEYAAE